MFCLYWWIVDHHCLNFLLFCLYWLNCWPLFKLSFVLLILVDVSIHGKIRLSMHLYFHITRYVLIHKYIPGDVKINCEPLSCALIVSDYLPMDRNKCLCSTSKDEDTDKKFLRKHNLNEIRVLSFVYVNGSGSVHG